MGHEATVRGLGMSRVGEERETPVVLLEASDAVDTRERSEFTVRKQPEQSVAVSRHLFEIVEVLCFVQMRS
jgi:hypothetical protein